MDKYLNNNKIYILTLYYTFKYNFATTKSELLTRYNTYINSFIRLSHLYYYSNIHTIHIGIRYSFFLSILIKKIYDFGFNVLDVKKNHYLLCIALLFNKSNCCSKPNTSVLNYIIIKCRKHVNLTF